MFTSWMIWLIAAGVLLLIELLTGTISFLCFSIGCLAALLPALAGVSPVWQVTAFALCALLSFVYLRPAIKRASLQVKGADARTNMDAIIGRLGKVTHPVTRYADDKGRVQVDGDSWLAYTDDADTPIPVGTQVVVEHYDSIVLRVKRKQ